MPSGFRPALWALTATFGLVASSLAADAPVTAVDKHIAQVNRDANVPTAVVIDDLQFLRRITIDLIGRIPTAREIEKFQEAPAASRRAAVVEKLIADPRFVDRWAMFYGDQLRLRANAIGGYGVTAFVRKAVETGMPYDEMCRKLIAANGKVGSVGEVGYILGDDADPMALAGVTAQVFLGVRISCAQCHNHPFDQWTREQFYGFAAFFGKTRRFENRLTRTIYTSEADTMSIMWPPEDKAKGKQRKPVTPAFPFDFETDAKAPHLQRLAAVRAKLEADRVAKNKPKPANIDDLLGGSDTTIDKTIGSGKKTTDLEEEARKAAAALRVQDDLYKASILRQQLAAQVTDPRNRMFARNLVNRLWNELVGRGFVMPVDDFRSDNPIAHEAALDYLAEEFVASNFDLKSIVRLIVNSRTYQLGQLAGKPTPAQILAAEKAFTATSTRRMLGEVLYDSLVTAGHLSQVKHPAGMFKRKIRYLTYEMVAVDEKEKPNKKKPALNKMDLMPAPGGYDLESAIDSALEKGGMKGDGVMLDSMKKMSKEEVEAMMMKAPPGKRMRAVEKIVEKEIDDNPVFPSAAQMAAPAPPAHFLRIFGQTDREQLGEARDHSPSMRQALMLLNGKLVNEAARVGKLEPMYELLGGPKPDIDAAIRMAYRDILTRTPTAAELTDGKAILADAATPLDGMADLRWVLLNCHEFRYLP